MTNKTEAYIKYDKFYDEIYAIRGCAVFGDYDDMTNPDRLPYVEVGIVANTFINKAKEVISKYGYTIVEEEECEGSDYQSYCIWFKE